MIQPESFSDSQQAFEHFRKVTNPAKFLKSKGLVYPRWRLVLWLAALPVTIWLVHFCLVHRFFPPSIVYVIIWFYVMTLPKDIALWLGCVYVGIIAWVIAFSLPYVLLRWRWTKKALESKAILKHGVVKGWNWFGPKVQSLMLQQFTEYLADRGFYNPEALHQLMDNTRDEIQARWRALPVILTLGAVVVGLISPFVVSLFSRYLVIANTSSEDIMNYLKVVSMLVLLICFIYIVFSFHAVPMSFRYLNSRMERAIYMHCLSNIRLSLLKRCKHRRPISKPAQRKIRHQRPGRQQ
jgi:hypothetical protein